MTHFLFTTQAIIALSVLTLGFSSLQCRGVGITIPGLASFSQGQAASGGGVQAAASGSGSLLGNVLGSSSSKLNELSNMGLDVSSILNNNGGLGGVLSTLTSNNELVDMVRQMPLSDSIGKVLNIFKNSIPDITKNGGVMASGDNNGLDSQSRHSFLNSEQTARLLDRLSRPSSDTSTEILSNRDQNRPLNQRLSEAPNELVNNQPLVPQQQLQQQRSMLNNQNQMINNQLLPGPSSQNSLMNRLNQYGELQPPANMPMSNMFPSQAQLQNQLPTQNMNSLLQGTTSNLLQPSGQLGSAAASPMQILASSQINPNLLNQLVSSGLLQNANITPELISQLSSSGVLQNANSIPDLISRLSSSGMLQNMNLASLITPNLLAQLGSSGSLGDMFSQLSRGAYNGRSPQLSMQSSALQPNLLPQQHQPVQVNQGLNFVQPNMVGRSPVVGNSRDDDSNEDDVGLEPDELVKSSNNNNNNIDDDSDSIKDSGSNNSSNESKKVEEGKEDPGTAMIGMLMNMLSSQ